MPMSPYERGTEANRITMRLAGAILALAVAVLPAGGCTRAYYRDYADRDVLRAS